MLSIVAPINQINNDLYDGVLLFRVTFSNQQGQGHQSIVGQTLATIRTIKDAIAETAYRVET